MFYFYSCASFIMRESVQKCIETYGVIYIDLIYNVKQ